jgi:glutathione S-transferase
MYLAEKGIDDVELVDVGEPGAPKLSDAYLGKGAFRLVPCLELDDGTLIGEAPVICRYLERLYPEPPLLGRDPREEALIAMWERKCENEGVQACGELLRNKARAFAGRALPGYTVAIEQIPALVDRAVVRIGAFYEKLDRRLADSEFLAGDGLSLADITGFCAVEMARAGKQEIPESCANLRRWHGAMARRPSASA